MYDYHPLSISLHAKHFAKSESINFQGIPSDVLFSYLCQLTSAISTIHNANLAVRVLDATKILLTGKNRIRINCCGILDILAFDDRKSLLQHQQEDLFHFGQLILSLACGSLGALLDLPKAFDYISKQYSHEIKDIVVYLLSPPTAQKSIRDIASILIHQYLHEIDSSLRYLLFLRRQNDGLEDELGRELENGRLFRLVCKLGFINERPE